jgi:CspA family cold shock protein
VKGTVASFDRGRGYGFITGDDGKTYLVHFLAVKTGTALVAGNRVEFKPVKTAKGAQAADVSVVTS